ncbi:MAG: DUF1295 domain-containing protein [Terriglobales bacterium]
MNYYPTLAFVLWGYMSLWFVISLVKKRNDVADVAWGLGFVLVAWTSFFLGGRPGTRGLMVGVLVSTWGLRLAWHIHSRNQGKPEDYRYRAWREEWGRWFYARSYVQVYLLQGALLFLVSLPVLIVNKSVGGRLGVLDVIGICVWLGGFVFESWGDAQLAQFVRDPLNRGRILQSGLWRYTRHPNYFGEVAQWWGLGLVALAVRDGWVGMIGPFTITFLILKVSGIPMLEKRLAQNPAFAEYKRKTSVFLPWFPKQ